MDMKHLNRKLFSALISLFVLMLLGGPLTVNADPLKVGQVAPDFTLETYERNDRITLSSFRGDRPVVLIFGSYT